MCRGYRAARDLAEPLPVRYRMAHWGNGSAVILSGSCSVMSNDQEADYQSKGPSLAVDVERLMKSNEGYDEEVLAWSNECSGTGAAPLIFATAGIREVQLLQQTQGAAESSEAIENFFGRMAIELVARGVQRVVVAGGGNLQVGHHDVGSHGVRSRRADHPGCSLDSIPGWESGSCLDDRELRNHRFP